MSAEREGLRERVNRLLCELENCGFGAGAEEREGGSTRRQDLAKACAERIKTEILALLDAGEREEPVALRPHVLAAQERVRDAGLCGEVFNGYDGQRMCVLPAPCEEHPAEPPRRASEPTEAERGPPAGDWTELIRLVMSGYAYEAAEKARAMAMRATEPRRPAVDRTPFLTPEAPNE